MFSVRFASELFALIDEGELEIDEKALKTKMKWYNVAKNHGAKSIKCVR